MSADHQTRVRVGVPNSELLADATTVKKEINEVGVGSFKMTFNHDMTSSFKWGGIILLLIILKVVRKVNGKAGQGKGKRLGGGGTNGHAKGHTKVWSVVAVAKA